jgi:hypothetical protein
MLMRELNGPRYSHEDAGPIWEDLDPMGLGATPLKAVSEPEGQVIHLAAWARSGGSTSE